MDFIFHHHLQVYFGHWVFVVNHVEECYDVQFFLINNVKVLEVAFLKQKYISKPERKKLAQRLGLKDSQVIISFSNDA